MDASQKYEGPTAGIPMRLSKFSTTTGAILKLQIPIVPGSSTTFLDAKCNVAKDVEVRENISVETFVYNKAHSRLGGSAIVIDRNRSGRPIRY